jgi:hypothetical protein
MVVIPGRFTADFADAGLSEGGRMGDYTGKLAKEASGVLADGETLLAGARAMAKGFTKGSLYGGIGGAVGGAIGAMVGARGAKGAAGSADATAAAFPKDAMIAIGLTDRRLLVWRRSKMTGGVKDLAAEYPIERVASVAPDSTRAIVKVPTLVIGFDDGSTVTVEVVRFDGTDGLVSAFERVKSARS